MGGSGQSEIEAGEASLKDVQVRTASKINPKISTTVLTFFPLGQQAVLDCFGLALFCTG